MKQHYSAYRLILTILSIIAAMILVLPQITLISRVFSLQTWQRLIESVVLDAIWLSLRTTIIAAILILGLGIPLSYILARWEFPGKSIVNLLVQLPIVLPPSVAGLALLLTFGRRGILGPTLSMAGITLPFTTEAVIVAQIFVAAPFFIRTAQLGFVNIADDLVDAARVDGASGFGLFFYIMLPLAWPAILVGLTLAWTRALGEFGATILFAGRLQGETETLPLLVYGAFERGDIDAATGAGVILIAIAVMALIIAQILTRRFNLKNGEQAGGNLFG